MLDETMTSIQIHWEWFLILESKKEAKLFVLFDIYIL